MKAPPPPSNQAHWYGKHMLEHATSEQLAYIADMVGVCYAEGLGGSGDRASDEQFDCAILEEHERRGIDLPHWAMEYDPEHVAARERSRAAFEAKTKAQRVADKRWDGTQFVDKHGVPISREDLIVYDS